MLNPEDIQIMFKCRKCRKILFSEKEACNSHGESLISNETETCNPISEVYYLREDVLLPWMKDQVNSGNWMKGKLFCPHCNCRIGSFNFVGGSKCHCGLSVLPSLHVVSHKLDRECKNILMQLLRKSKLKVNSVVDCPGTCVFTKLKRQLTYSFC